MEENTIQNMTRSELKALIREVFEEVLNDLNTSSDPDAGLVFRPVVAERLRSFLHERPDGEPVEDVIRDLGLDV